jgi:chloramphenicol O-acetyltransferase type A
MKFTPLELQTWPRGQMFYYFAKMAPTGYSLTVELDVTHLHRAVKAARVKFFPAYLWLVTKNLNRQVEFKVAEKEGKLGY